MEILNETLFRIVSNPAWHTLFFDVFFLLCSGIFFTTVIIVALVLPAFFFLFSSYPKQKMLRIWLCYVLSLLFTYVIVEITKGVVGAPRPLELFQDIIILSPYGTNDSFPSMHAALSFALAGASFFWSKRAGYLTLLFATMVLISRVYIGVHFPIDVLVGALIGSIVALFFRYFFNTYFEK